MRVLFYLPLVTPWWFEHVIEPLIRRVAGVAEVHILVPPLWRNTGIGPEQLLRCVDLEHVHWCIIDGEDHPSLRSRAADPAALIDYAHRLSPDLVLCRTADFETASALPGAVRFLMEAAAAPFAIDPSTITITANPFIHGALPDLTESFRADLNNLIDPLWSAMQRWRRAECPERDTVLRHLRLGADRPLLLLPLEYEHEENFFLQHRLPTIREGSMLPFVRAAVASRCAIAVTDHPLNKLHVDRSGLHDSFALLGDEVVLAAGETWQMPETTAIASSASGIVLADSKCFSLAAAFGLPILRLSKFESAKWLNVSGDLDQYVADVVRGAAAAPSEYDARLWFAYHFANEAFLPNDRALTGEEIIDRALQPINPARWQTGISQVGTLERELAL